MVGDAVSIGVDEDVTSAVVVKKPWLDGVNNALVGEMFEAGVVAVRN